ncbi:hypothetical protein OM427_20710 [Halomonas sp. 18H]|uniref:hypothetical protein n=1 Tax=Halomonas almeriensis TaxID=308163 RepID=UPI002232AD55|nr:MULTISPECIES: hypothetical protein [Halomonas]MCW4151943.1 hypothetical protein [Halomonas sp. 18H]MDN3554178.1 hypothetical protein [Halomonas almeriensis]
MKYQNTRQPLDEREKLRKFRELDDAFAEALRDLEQPGEQPRSPAAETSEATPVEREVAFKQQLETLMREYALPAESVSDLLSTMKALGRIA